MKTFIRDNFTPPKSNSLSDSSVKPRLEYIDLAKGICIILVVMYHCSGMPFLHGFKILRIPLYFFLSGMFFKHYDCFTTFLLKKTNNLIVPLVFFELLYCLMSIIVLNEFRFDELFAPMNGPLWFLMSLVTINIVYYFISKYSNSLCQFVVIVLLAAIGYKMTDLLGTTAYLCNSLIALPIFYMGNMFMKNGGCEQFIKRGNTRVVFIMILTFCFIMALYHWFAMPYIEFSTNYFYGNVFVCYIISGLTVICFMSICKKIGSLYVISYCGRYSLIILGTHMIVMGIILPMLYIFFDFSPSPTSRFVHSIIISWLSIPFFRKYFPYFTAQKNLFEAIRRRWATPAEELATK